MQNPPRFKRVLLKLSGEILMGDQAYGLNAKVVNDIAEDIAQVHGLGVEVALVIGGGNIFRGVSGVAQGLDRTKSDFMGMLATVMNALALSSRFESMNVQARVMSAIPMPAVCQPYIHEKAMRHLRMGRILIFAAGTGNPFFTTDTAAALRAAEMKCDVLLKGTKVNGVYAEDPVKNPQAQFYHQLTYQEVLAKNLKVMDAAAIALAQECEMPVEVFSIGRKNAFMDIILGKGIFTRVTLN